jgi:hypothetical protein
MPSKEEIESSRIPTSLFLLSTILLRATTRTTLEDKDESEEHREEEALKDGHREDKDGDREDKDGDREDKDGEAVEEGEHGEAVEEVEEVEEVEDGEAVEAVEDGEAVEEGDREEVEAVEKGDREEGEHREEDDILGPKLSQKRRVTFMSSAPALLPESPALAPGPAPAPAPAPPPESKRSRGLRESPALSTRVTRLQAAKEAAIATGVIPSASAPILSPRTGAELRLSSTPTSRSRRSSPSAYSPLTPVREESEKSISEESKLKEVLNYLDNKVFTDEGIKEILRSIDNIIESHNLSNVDDLNKLSQTLQEQHGIIITPETISINIAQEK